jgi:hypothetical protein
MSRVLISCPRCEQKTAVELERSVSAQRCDRCGMFLYGAETGIKVERSRRKHRRKGWRSIFSTASSQARVSSIDPDSPEFARARRMPRWFPAMVLSAVVCVGAVIWWNIKRAKEQGAGAAGPDLVAQTGADASATPEWANFTADPADVAWSEDARKAADVFLKARTVKEVLDMIRHRSLYEQDVRKMFAAPAALPISDEGAYDFAYRPVTKQGDPIAMVLFNNRAGRVQGVVMVKTSAGILADWPSFSGCGEMSVADFAARHPAQPVLVRVAAKRADYYNFGFADATKFICLRLTEYPEQTVLYGYAPVDAPFAEKLKRLPLHDPGAAESAAGRPEPLTIRAVFPQSSQGSRNQVLILEILGNGWYVP